MWCHVSIRITSQRKSQQNRFKHFVPFAAVFFRNEVSFSGASLEFSFLFFCMKQGIFLFRLSRRRRLCSSFDAIKTGFSIKLFQIENALNVSEFGGFLESLPLRIWESSKLLKKRTNQNRLLTSRDSTRNLSPRYFSLPGSFRNERIFIRESYRREYS